MPRGWGACSWLLPRTSALQHSLLEREDVLLAVPAPCSTRLSPYPANPMVAADGGSPWPSPVKC